MPTTRSVENRGNLASTQRSDDRGAAPHLGCDGDASSRYQVGGALIGASCSMRPRQRTPPTAEGPSEGPGQEGVCQHSVGEHRGERPRPSACAPHRARRKLRATAWESANFVSSVRADLCRTDAAVKRSEYDQGLDSGLDTRRDGRL